MQKIEWPFTSREIGFKVLDHKHTMNNDATIETERKIVAGWTAFSVHHRVLTTN